MEELSFKLKTFPKLLEQLQCNDLNDNINCNLDANSFENSLANIQKQPSENVTNNAYDFSSLNYKLTDSQHEADDSKILQLVQVMTTVPPGFEFEKPVVLTMGQLQVKMI